MQVLVSKVFASLLQLLSCVCVHSRVGRNQRIEDGHFHGLDNGGGRTTQLRLDGLRDEVHKQGVQELQVSLGQRRWLLGYHCFCRCWVYDNRSG